MGKNSFWSRLPLVAFMVCVFAVSAAAEQYEDFTYTDNGADITITGYTGYNDAVNFPDTIDGKPAVSIGDYVFDILSRSTSVVIPSSVTSIGNYAFSTCRYLTAITVDELNPSYSSVDGILFNKSKTTLICCPQGKKGSYTIPDSVTSIGEGAFEYCRGLTSITIPDSVTSIGEGAFEYCRGLTSITIPDSITSIGADTFYFCTGLTSVTIPDSVTSIGDKAFYYCDGLTSVTIPDGVISIGNSAFSECTGLARAVFMGKAPSMGTKVFDICASNFTVYYLDGALDFISPIWKGYPSAILSYPVVFTAGANGSIDGTKTQTVKYEENCTAVTAVPATDCHFIGWTGAYSGLDNPLTISNVTASMAITANFAHNTATLTLSVSGNGNAGSTSANPLNTMTATPILATPDANSHFTGWTVTSGLATIANSKSAATTVKLTGADGSSATITANFAENAVATAVPAAPVVSASDGTYEDRVVLTWKAAPTATSYEVYRNTTKLAPVPGDRLGEVVDNIFEDNTAVYGTSYYYFARAKNSLGWSKFSAGNSGYIAKAPAVLGAVTASDGKYFDKIRVSWAKVPRATSYLVYRTDSPFFFIGKPIAETTALFIDDFGDDIVPMNGSDVKKYYYWLVAENANEATSMSMSNAGYISNKGPTAVTASNSTYSNGIVVTWKAVPGATAYDVYRYTDSKYTQIDDAFGSAGVASPGAVLEYEDSSAEYDIPYYYKVKAKYGYKYDSALSLTGAAGKNSGASNPKTTNINDGNTSSNIIDKTKGSILYFSTEVPAGTVRLVATLNGTSNSTANDCNVYAKFANYPTVSSYNAKGVENSTNEVLTVSNPSEGTWYFMLYGVTEYSDVTLTVNCYSVADIVLTQIPVNDLPIPFKAVFKGRVVDEIGTGIPNMILQVRNPITGLTSFLPAKTDAKGFFSYSTKIGSEGEHTFDFFFTDIPDTAKGIASHTVATRKGCFEDNSFFDSSAYVPAAPVAVPLQADIIGLQNFLNTRNGWTDGTFDNAYATMWVESTLVKAKDDAQLESQLVDGLYLLLYGVEGAGVGNDTTNTSALSAVPFVVHVEATKQGDVLTALNTLGIISGAQKTDIEAGSTGIIAVTSLSDPDEGLTPVDISLLAREQLELLANLAAGDASFVEDKIYSGVAAKILTVMLASGRQINVVVAGFVK
ncbi:MAG: leucine-rich repeat protein [Victivallales bacterium]